MFSAPMNILDLTPTQLKRAAAVKEHIERLNKELRDILGVSGNYGVASTKKPTMSTSVKKRIAPAQKARWANVRRDKSTTTSSTRPTANAKKKMSPATRAKLSRKLKAYWAAKKTGKK